MNSTEAYIKKYGQGYGVMHAEGNVIQFYEKFLKYELGIDGSNGQKVLDFGCGLGTHMGYFSSKGFDVFGVDVVLDAINQAKRRQPRYKKNFVCIEHAQDISRIFEMKFDILFANRSLYYLSNMDLENTLTQMDSILNPKGVVYFTMMGTKSYYYGQSVEMKDGLRKVSLSGRLNETTYIGFIHDEEELIRKFRMFKPYFVGHYDCTIREGSRFHYQFIGLKRE